MHSPRFLFTLLALFPFALLSNYDIVAPNGTEIEEFFANGVTMGYDLRDYLFCEPEFVGRLPELSRDYINQEINKQNRNLPSYLIPLLPGFAKKHIKDARGDTVMVLWSGGTFATIIDELLYRVGECNEEFVCSLKPIEEVPERPERSREFIALRKERFYHGPIIPYTEYEIRDSSYLAIRDSLSEVMNRTWLAEDSARFEETLARKREADRERFVARWRKLHADKDYPFNQIYFTNQSVKSEIPPDSMFLFVVGDLTYATEFSWCALLEIRRIDGVWQPREMRPPHNGPHNFLIRFAFDLNGDGELEYLINNSIFTFIDGELTPVLYGPYRGC